MWKKSFLSDISVGDYAFIKLEKEFSTASIIRFWKLKDINESDGIYNALFDEVCTFDPIEVSKFERLDLFKLDKTLLNSCNKQVKNISFFEIITME